MCILGIITALIDFRLAVPHGKQINRVANPLGAPQEQRAAWFECIVKQGNQLLLQVGAEINQKIAATDQVEFRERRILDEILLGEDQQVADSFVNAVSAAVGFERKEASQSLR